MNTKLILSALLSLALTACAPDSKKDSDPIEVKLTSTDVTDRSQCYGQTAVGINLKSNRWEYETRFSNGATITQTLDFNNGQFTMTAHAYFKGQSSQLRIQSTYSEYANNSIFILGATEQSDQIRAGNEVFSYRIHMSSTFMSYSFKGPCLFVDTGDGKPNSLVPVY